MTFKPVARMMIATLIGMLAITFLPGMILSKWLDSRANLYRRILLAPAIGTLFCLGLAGLLTTLSLWSAFNFVLVLMISLIILLMFDQPSSKEAMSFKMITVKGKQMRREFELLVIIPAIAVVSFIWPLIESYPFGVDWIGFATLTGHLSQNSSLMASGDSIGWFYPPAFPALASFNAMIFDLDSAQSVFYLGHFILFALLCGILGAMERFESGFQSLIAMFLAAGIFAKTFDSGYPTVAGLLGLIPGILIFFAKTDRKFYRNRAFSTMFIALLFIHPTGLIYLSTLIFAHFLATYTTEHNDKLRQTMLISTILISTTAIIGLFFIAPRLTNQSVFSEYGWQGGAPLIFYNGLLLVLGLYAAFRVRHSLEGRTGIIWLASLWLLTGVHFLEQWSILPLISVLSYTLYSMGIHAFHIPLAVLVGLMFAPQKHLTKLEGTTVIAVEKKVKHDNLLNTAMTFAVAFMILTLGQGILFELSNHDELRGSNTTQGWNVEWAEQLSESSLIYTEKAHWGTLWDIPEGISVTSSPNLGLLESDHSLQNSATRAIIDDQVEETSQLGITHAITSARGVMQFYLGESQYWTKVDTYLGSTLWQFTPTSSQQTSEYYAILPQQCSDQCDSRLDVWHGHRFIDPIGQGSERIFIPAGETLDLEFEMYFEEKQVLMMVEYVGEVEKVSFNFANTSISSSAQQGKMDLVEFGIMTVSGATTLKIDLSESHLSTWINPTGFSGRGDRIVDSNGIILHWLEMA